MKQRVLSLVLVISMILSMFSNLAFAENVDINDYQNHWAAQIITKWIDKEIIRGYEDGSFKPDNEITRAEFAQIIVNLFGLNDVKESQVYTDVNQMDWFYNAVNCLSSTNIMHENSLSTYRPNDKITREEAVYAVANVFNITGITEHEFVDELAISDWALDSIKAMYTNKYINGMPNGNFEPKKGLTRAEFMKIIDNTTQMLINKAGTYNENVDGNVIVNTTGAVLEDVKVSGNLYLTQGIKDGDVTLKNTSVTGTVFIEGGGVNSIHIDNCNFEHEIIIDSKNPIRVENKGNGIDIRVKESNDVIINGVFSNVTAEQGSKISAKESSIKSIIIDANANDQESTTQIDLDKTSKVEQVIANGSVKVTGDGAIDSIVINANGVSVEQDVDNVTITSDDIEAEIGGQKVNKDTLEPQPSQPTPNPIIEPIPNPDPSVDDEYENYYEFMSKLLVNEKVKNLMIEPTSGQKEEYSKEIANWNQLTEDEKDVTCWLIANEILWSTNDVSDRLKENITRKGIAKIVVSDILGFATTKWVDEQKSFDDVKDGEEGFIYAFVQLGLAKGIYSNNAYNPKDNVTSDDVDKIFENLTTYIKANGIENIEETCTINISVTDESGKKIEGADLNIISNTWDDIKTDVNGNAVVEVDTKTRVIINCSYIDDEGYGYKTFDAYYKLFKDITLNLVVEKEPVVIFKAVDKNDCPMTNVEVYKNNNGDEYLFTIISSAEGETVFKRDSDEPYIYKMKNANGDLVELTNIEIKENKVDEYKTEITIKLKDYGLNETIKGKITFEDGSPCIRAVVILSDNTDESSESIYVLTDKNGDYEFTNINIEHNYSIHVNNYTLDGVEYIFKNYSTNPKITKDITLTKVHSYDIYFVDKYNHPVECSKVTISRIVKTSYGTSKRESTRTNVGYIYEFVDTDDDNINFDITATTEDGITATQTVTVDKENYNKRDIIVKLDNYESDSNMLKIITGDKFNIADKEYDITRIEISGNTESGWPYRYIQYSVVQDGIAYIDLKDSSVIDTKVRISMYSGDMHLCLLENVNINDDLTIDLKPKEYYTIQGAVSIKDAAFDGGIVTPSAITGSAIKVNLYVEQFYGGYMQVDSVTVDENGNYYFDNIPNGKYYVRTEYEYNDKLYCYCYNVTVRDNNQNIDISLKPTKKLRIELRDKETNKLIPYIYISITYDDMDDGIRFVENTKYTDENGICEFYESFVYGQEFNIRINNLALPYMFKSLNEDNEYNSDDELTLVLYLERTEF